MNYILYTRIFLLLSVGSSSLLHALIFDQQDAIFLAACAARKPYSTRQFEADSILLAQQPDAPAVTLAKPLPTFFAQSTGTASPASQPEPAKEPLIEPKKIYTCKHPECSLFFYEWHKFSRHYKTVHSYDKNVPCLVAGCAETFKSATARDKHIKTFHGRTKAPAPIALTAIAGTEYYTTATTDNS